MKACVKRDPHSTVAANNLAMLLVTYRTDKPSLDRARALAERFASSRNPALIDTWGWVLYKRGENADAISALQKAVDKSPQSPVLLYHLAMAQLKSGARDSARTSLEQALKSSAAFSGRDEAKKDASRTQTLNMRAGPLRRNVNVRCVIHSASLCHQISCTWYCIPGSADLFSDAWRRLLAWACGPKFIARSFGHCLGKATFMNRTHPVCSGATGFGLLSRRCIGGNDSVF